MTAATPNVPRPAGMSRLIEDCAAVSRLARPDDARNRLEVVLGPELASRLLVALNRRGAAR